MQIHSLELANEFSLIGIHTSVEDYKLAYLINLNMKASFSKFKTSLDFENKNASFSVFEFIDEKNQFDNFLISNKYNESINNETNTGLFTDSVSYSVTSYLIPEKKEIDYFLKIEGDISEKEIESTVGRLNKIHQIITSYSINPTQLKSKDYLIF